MRFIIVSEPTSDLQWGVYLVVSYALSTYYQSLWCFILRNSLLFNKSDQACSYNTTHPWYETFFQGPPFLSKELSKI